MEAQDKVMHRGLAVLGAICIQLSLGAIYAWSVFTGPLTKAGWTKTETQVVFSVGLVVFALVMVWAGKNLAKIGPRKLTVAAGITLGLGYVLAGLLGATSFPVLIACIGIVAGAGIGLGYVVPIAVGIRWFPDKKGMITGLAVAGFGFGALGWVKFAGPWLELIKNQGLANTFIIYGVVFAVLVLIGSIWMRFPPEGWLPAGYSPHVCAPGATSDADSGKGLHSSEMIRQPQFYLIFLTFVFSAGAGLMTIGLMQLYPKEALGRAGFDPASVTAIFTSAMGFFALANGLGRIIWGMISDKLGRKRSIALMTAIQGVVMAGFTYAAGIPNLLYLAAIIVGFNFGGNFALFPTITADTFGAKRVGENYPFVFLAYGVGGVFGPILGGVLGDQGNFPMAFAICGGLCLLGSVLTLMVKQPCRAQ